MISLPCHSRKSYIWSTLGMTASTFNLGAMAFWMPTFMTRTRVFLGLQPLCTEGSCPTSDRCGITFDAPPTYLFSRYDFLNTLRCFFPRSFALGAVTMVTGVLGGCGGTMFSRLFRVKVPHVDPLICAAGLLGAAPCFLVTIFVASASIATAYVRRRPSILAGLLA